jgi:hypothetical protein
MWTSLGPRPSNQSAMRASAMPTRPQQSLQARGATSSIGPKLFNQSAMQTSTASTSLTNYKDDAASLIEPPRRRPQRANTADVVYNSFEEDELKVTYQSDEHLPRPRPRLYQSRSARGDRFRQRTSQTPSVESKAFTSHPRCS